MLCFTDLPLEIQVLIFESDPILIVRGRKMNRDLRHLLGSSYTRLVQEKIKNTTWNEVLESDYWACIATYPSGCRSATLYYSPTNKMTYHRVYECVVKDNFITIRVTYGGWQHNRCSSDHWGQEDLWSSYRFYQYYFGNSDLLLTIFHDIFTEQLRTMPCHTLLEKMNCYLVLFVLISILKKKYISSGPYSSVPLTVMTNVSEENVDNDGGIRLTRDEEWKLDVMILEAIKEIEAALM